MSIEAFDTKTITGAMEYIIAYAKKNMEMQGCFYTGSWFADDRYESMVERLLELQKNGI